MSNDQQHNTQQSGFSVQNRMTFHGPVIAIFAPITLIGVFIFGVFAATHWQKLIAMSSGIILWSLTFLAIAAGIVLTWASVKLIILPLLHGGTEVYRHIEETRTSVKRDRKILALQDNYVVLETEKGRYELLPVSQERHTYSHKVPPLYVESEGVENIPQLLAPHLPTDVKYEDIRGKLSADQSLVGISEQGIETRDNSIRALVWVVGSSGTGKTNTVSIRVDEDYQRGNQFLVVDPHAFKEDSLYNAIKGYRDRFLMPMAQKSEEITNSLDFFLTEFYARRDHGASCDIPITLIIDEVGSLADTSDEIEEANIDKLKRIARICGQESRGFNMQAIFISQTATGLSWLRKMAIMVIAHQVVNFNERVLACNEDRKLARAMDNWPIGRTLIYGVGFQSGTLIVQQPIFSSVKKLAYPVMPEIPMHQPPTQKSPSDPELETARSLIQQGITGPRALERAMGISYYRASQLWQRVSSSD